MAVAERFGRLRRIGDNETGVRVRQVKSKKVDLALHAADDAEGLAKIHLSVTRRVGQRHKHFLRPLPLRRHVILDDGDAASEPMLVPQTLEYPLRRMLLLLGLRLVLFKNAVDDRDKRPKLWPHWRLGPPIAGWNRKPQHLRDRSRVDPKPPSCRSLAQCLNTNRMSDLKIKFHALHPSPRQKRQRLAQLPDFYSGATDQLGRFIEGFLLRRLHHRL